MALSVSFTAFGHDAFTGIRLGHQVGETRLGFSRSIASRPADDLDDLRQTGEIAHSQHVLTPDPVKALRSRHIEVGLIFHSVRGSQYGNTTYRQILSKNVIRQSMSARANPYHNA